LKKELTSGKIVVLLLGIMLVLFAWCNLLVPVAGMGGADYYQIASGGFWLNSGTGCQTWFSSIPAENSYTGTMNVILRPLSVVFHGFDVRILSTLYFAAALVAFFFFLAKMQTEKLWHKALVGGVATFIFCDFSYLLHLNSLNVEGALYCFILVMVCLLFSQLFTKPGICRTLLYSVLAFLVAGMKTGYFWIGILLVVCQLPVLMIKKELWYRIVTVFLTVAVSIGCVTCFSDGVYYGKEQQNKFHSVYYGVLKDNEDSSALEKLGLPREADAYVGKSVYEVDSSVVENASLNVGYSKVISYYLTHPGTFLKKLECSADNGYEIRQQYNSNYPEYHKIKHGFDGYSALKRRVMQPDLWFVLVFLGAVIAFSAVQMKKQNDEKKKAYYLTMILICTTTLAVFLAPVIISGEAALGAELFLYNLFFDIVLCYVIVGGTIMICKRRETIQKKYGVEQ